MHTPDDATTGRLQLPENWPSYSAGALAGWVLDRLVDDAARRWATSAFIAATLDLTLATRWRRTRPDLRVIEDGCAMWRVGEMVYAFISVIDDDAVELCLQLAKQTVMVQMIVPPRCEGLMRFALDSILGRTRPVVSEIGDFVNMHASSAMIDGDITYEDATVQIMKRYNERARSAGLEETALVKLA